MKLTRLRLLGFKSFVEPTDFMLEPGWEREEHKAFFEFIEREGWEYEYTGYSNGFPSTSAAVVLTRRR